MNAIRMTPMILSTLFLSAAGMGRGEELVALPSWETKPEIAGILRLVPPLKHPMPAHWQPTLFWWQAPLAFDDPETLKAELKALADRGLSPCIGLDAEYKSDSAKVERQIVQAKAVADAGYPVNIQMLGGLDLYVRSDGRRIQHADTPDGAKVDAVGGTMPCLVLKDGWRERAEHVAGLFRKLAAAKVPVQAVWYDYEGHPHPWNGVFEHSQNCPSCRKEFPAGILDNRSQFMAWAEDLRSEAMAAVFAKPVRESYPQAKLGFYNHVESSREHPYVDYLGLCHPPSGVKPLEIDAIQPVCYASTSSARRYFNADWPVDSEAMDAVYFTSLLRAASRAHLNIRANQVVMPFVSSWVMSSGDERVPRMSKPLYHEFLRHAILRGARGFYCFNVAPPYGAMPDYYGELADINAVYNGMFAYREFLEGGVPMNQTWPDPKDSRAVVWSGLRLGDKALVRVVALGPGPRVVEITPFTDKSVRLIASPEGSGYIVDNAGGVQASD